MLEYDRIMHFKGKHLFLKKKACLYGNSSKLNNILILMNLLVKKKVSVNQKTNKLSVIRTDSGTDLKMLRNFYRKAKLRDNVFLSLLKEAIHDEGDRVLQAAVLSEDLKIVQRLCFLMKENSVSFDSTNYRKQTPLHWAVILGNVNIIKVLLSLGASPLICDQTGKSVLHLAMKLNWTDVLKLLLEHNQIKNVLNVLDHNGYSVLHYAVMNDNKEAVKRLHSSGTDMNTKDGKSGRTCLIYAVLRENVCMVKLLLKLGSCPKKADYSGRTALDMATEIRHLQLIKLLEKWIAESKKLSAKEQAQPLIKSVFKD